MAGQIIPFARLSDAIYLISMMPNAPTTYQVLPALFFLATAIIVAITARTAKSASTKALLIIANVCILAYAIQSNFVEQRYKFYKIEGYSIAASQTAWLAKLRSTMFLDAFDQTGGQLENSKFRPASEHWEALKQQKEKLLLIVVESWGVPTAGEIQREITAPVLAQSNLAMTSGHIPFSGLTVIGELRELCSSTSTSLNLKEIDRGFEKCLPNKLAAAGYKTTSIHGAAGSVYDRRFWYPKAGFQHSIFFEHKEWPERCHSFPGACDTDIAHAIPAEFENNERKLVYWLTLNSHTPYDIRDIKDSLFDCQKHDIPTDSETCRNLKLQAQFFHSIALILKDPRMLNVNVMLVGDHPPVIRDQQEKERYFQANRIPWLQIRHLDTH